MDTHLGACEAPLAWPSAAPSPPASHCGCLFSTDDASLMELGSCSLTQRAVPRSAPDVAAPPPPPGFIQSEAKTCCNLRGRGDNGREHGTKWLRVASWCVWGCYSCSWAEDAFPGAGCPRSVLITWDLRDSSGCFRARPFSLEKSGSDGLPCPWTRFKGQATTAQEKLGEISDLNPPIPHPQNCPLYRKHKSGSVWTLSSAFTKK